MAITRIFHTTLITLAVFGFLSGLVFAHHSVAGYDNSKEVPLRGTVVEYNWRNPHVFVVWDVKGEDGKVTQWSAEMNSPTSMIQVGMSRTSLKKGDEIIVTVNPSKTGKPLGVVRKITMADGRLVVDRFTPQ
jgi:hypothetical protein